MSRIYFNHDTAWAQLKSIGTVATLRVVTGGRQYRGTLSVYRHGKDTGFRVKSTNVGYIHIPSYPGRVASLLEQFLYLSGFDSVAEWVIAAHEMSGPDHVEWGVWVMELLGEGE